MVEQEHFLHCSLLVVVVCKEIYVFGLFDATTWQPSGCLSYAIRRFGCCPTSHLTRIGSEFIARSPGFCSQTGCTSPCLTGSHPIASPTCSGQQLDMLKECPVFISVGRRKKYVFVFKERNIHQLCTEEFGWNVKTYTVQKPMMGQTPSCRWHMFARKDVCFGSVLQENQQVKL